MEGLSCILLADDDRDDVEVMKRILTENRITSDIVVVHDGQEALDYIFRDGEYAVGEPQDEPCLAILDVELPGISGIDVLRRIRGDERTRSMPVTLLVSSAEERELVDGYGLGLVSYIRKPADYGQFLDAVKALDLYWNVLNEPPPAVLGRHGEE